MSAPQIGPADAQCTRCRNKHRQHERVPVLNKKLSVTLITHALVCPRCGCRSFYDLRKEQEAANREKPTV